MGKYNMKYLSIIFIVSSCSVIAQSLSNDFFPLSIGNTWNYTYAYSKISSTSTARFSYDGTATYTIISNFIATDSIIWNFQEVRNIIYEYHSGASRNPPFDTSYSIKDTAFFKIIEDRNENHAIIMENINNLSPFIFFQQTYQNSINFSRFHSNETRNELAYTDTLKSLSDLRVITASFVKEKGLNMVKYDYVSYPLYNRVSITALYNLINSNITSTKENITRMSPSKYYLYQNYPNPFNPSTTIKFILPKTSYTTLKIYDVLGREVSVLFEGELSAGINSCVLNASNLSSGVYFYTLQSDNLSATRKILLQK